MAVSDASTVRAVDALIRGCANIVAFANTSLALSNAVLASLSYMSSFCVLDPEKPLHDSCGCRHEAVVEGQHANKLLESFQCSGFRKLTNIFDFGWKGHSHVLVDVMAEKGDGSETKLAIPCSLSL